ncbi:MAG TPA: mobile mystery protein A [Bacteroidetes bacterium]|nr:mobile mystery protein A [Bacteroidota bacterium]
MDTRKLQIEQLERRIKFFAEAQKLPNPPTGWIKAVRLALGMTLQQLASKLTITNQSARELEIREKEGTITLKTLREAAQALDMDLVYGLVPKDGSLDNYIDKKAREMAKKIVNRTSTTMKLEDQENTQERIQKAIETRTEDIKQSLPKALWD